MRRLAVMTLASACLAVTALGLDRSPEPLPSLANASTWTGQQAGDGQTAGSDRDVVDLLALLGPHGAIAAGPAGSWRYVWPRDGAFVAPALAATGHGDRGWSVLRFLASVQEADGGFEARYLLDGSGPPDDRGRQSDGPGWLLWSLDETRRQTGGGPLPADLREARDRAVAFVLASTEQGTRLPEPSPDYWEVPERSLSLGAVAPLAAGLDAAARTYGAEEDAVRERSTAEAAAHLRQAIDAGFGPRFERYGDWGGHDAATAMLLPPFGPGSPAAIAAWRDYQREATRVSGGLAPGAGWKQDGVSWTPETALVAYTAAVSGEVTVARSRLAWLESRRTAWGSLPEKVRPDGLPAGPAPLAWTAALVVLTEQALGRPAGQWWASTAGSTSSTSTPPASLG